MAIKGYNDLHLGFLDFLLGSAGPSLGDVESPIGLISKKRSRCEPRGDRAAGRGRTEDGGENDVGIERSVFSAPGKPRPLEATGPYQGGGRPLADRSLSGTGSTPRSDPSVFGSFNERAVDPIRMNRVRHR
ncbi:hypothetical protein BHE74_00028117 [Ensete ventricosum]|nr:hypothetical protein GW17_00016778 [Ensete ventricosum]RWW64633.1 hypothetical protein BHE74_00028117 [Ensete ventricosum]RZR78454.1 hypothetical protein BHM03_00003806 [Ensete ventricosum]